RDGAPRRAGAQPLLLSRRAGAAGDGAALRRRRQRQLHLLQGRHGVRLAQRRRHLHHRPQPLGVRYRHQGQARRALGRLRGTGLLHQPSRRAAGHLQADRGRAAQPLPGGLQLLQLQWSARLPPGGGEVQAERRQGQGGAGVLPVKKERVMRILSCLLVVVALPVFAQSPPPSDPILWPEAQRAFLQDGPGLLLTLDQRESFLALDDAGRDAFIGEMLGRDPIPETPANELVEGIARRRRLVAAEPQTLLPQDARAQLLFLRGRPAERVVLDCAAIFKPMEIWAYPGDDGTPRDLVLYRPSDGEPFIQWLPIDSKRALYSNEAEYWLDQAEAEGRRVKRIDRFFCRDSSRVDKATGMDGIQRKQTGETAVSRWDLRGRSEDTIQDFRWARPRERAAFLTAPADLATWARAAAATPLPSAPAALKPGDVSLDFPYWQG